MPALLRIAPELPVSNVADAIAYYEQKLGFRSVTAMPGGDYAVVQRDDVAVHLFRSDQSDAPVSIHIFVDGLDEFHQELESGGIVIQQGIVRKPWGNRDFRVADPFGNDIKFTEPSPED